MKLTTKTVISLIGLMALVVTFVVGLAMFTWYEQSIEVQKSRLLELAHTRARMIEAVARYDRGEGHEIGRDDKESELVTLYQVREAHKSFSGFGKTGEFTLARKKDDHIQFILRHRHTLIDTPSDISWNSDFAMPMHKALSGHSGIMIGKDYRGIMVLAAHEPVGILGYGLVAKIDISEIREPFIEHGLQFLAASCFAIFIGALFFIKTSTPLIRRLEQNEALLSGIVDNTQDVIFAKDLKGRLIFLNKTGEKLFNTELQQLIGKKSGDIFPAQLARKFDDVDQKVIEKSKVVPLVGDIENNGTEQTFHIVQAPIVTEDGYVTGIAGIARDITFETARERIITENEELTRTITQKAIEGIILINHEGLIQFWNPGAEKIFGYKASEALGRCPHDFITREEDRENANKALNRFLNADHDAVLNRSVELKAIRKDGVEIDAELSLASLKRNGKLNVLGVVRDISLKKNSENALKTAFERIDLNARKFRNLFETAQISLWDEDFSLLCFELERYREKGVSDLKQYLLQHIDEAYELASLVKINNVNQETLKLYGVASKEDFYASIKQTFCDDAIYNFIDEVDALWQKKKSFIAQCKQRKIDGSEIHVIITVGLPQSDEEMKNVPVSVLDITENVLSRMRLERQKDTLRELQFIVDKSPVVVFSWKNEEGWPVEYVSQNVSDWGYTKEEFETGGILFKDIIDPQDLEKITAEVTQYIKSGNNTFTQEYRIITRDGSVKWLDDRTWTRRNAKGELTHLQGVCLDITERKEFERQLWQAQKSESLGNMAGGIAHDFNNMLLPVLALADLTAQQLEKENPIYTRMLKIKQAGENAQDLVKRLMVFAREEEVQLSPIVMSAMLLDTVELLKQTMPASMIIKYEPNMDDAYIEGSLPQLQSVFINIAKNAADALSGRNGEFSIQMDTKKSGQYLKSFLNGKTAETYIHIRLKDSGPGMSEEVLGRIFDPFFTTKPVGEGTGMGLAMARSIISNHHGVIKANSRMNKGTTFEIYLPEFQKE